jgi:hypothetical protein
MKLVLGLINALGLYLCLVSSKIQVLSTDPDFPGGDRVLKGVTSRKGPLRTLRRGDR